MYKESLYFFQLGFLVDFVFCSIYFMKLCTRLPGTSETMRISVRTLLRLGNGCHLGNFGSNRSKKTLGYLKS